jgi:cyclopropane-fatty-acyl-phospholipid synthase
MVLQTISVPDSALRTHVTRPGWIQRYIFPGAALPSVAAIERSSSRAGFRLRHVEDIGQHYATTLRHWRERFKASLAAVRELGYDERFVRQWEYYLCLSEAGFRAGVTSDVQVVLER